MNQMKEDCGITKVMLKSLLKEIFLPNQKTSDILQVLNKKVQ